MSLVTQDLTPMLSSNPEELFLPKTVLWIKIVLTRTMSVTKNPLKTLYSEKRF